MNYIYWLSQIKHSEQFLVGDRLFVLSQLLQHGHPIMPGFVLNSRLLSEFLESLDDSESLIGNLPDSSLHLNVNNYRVLQSVAQRSRKIVNEANFSSIWQEKIFQAAQQLNSQTLILHPFLAIPYEQHRGNRGLWRSHTCFLTPEALTTAVKKVWAELFTAKSLFYWQKLGLTIEKIDLAILVQPLKIAIASGIIDLETDRIHLQGTWGLEHSLLWGEIQPDEYLLDRQTGEILHRQLGKKNYAYRPQNFTATQHPDTALESYIPSETQWATHVLDDEAIAELFRLTQSLLPKYPQLKCLQWTQPQIEESTTAKPQFYFTQLNYYPTSLVSRHNRLVRSLSLPSTVQPLVVGLAAAAGSISANALVIEELMPSSVITPGCILVTKEIAPTQIPLLKSAGGIIVETGGVTSHAAIVARELNIPAIVDAAEATKIIANQRKIFLDGDTGRVYRDEDRQHLSFSHVSLSTPNYPISTRLMVNLSQPEAIPRALKLPVDGVGLLRSELMLGELLASQPMAIWQQQPQGLLDRLIELLRQFTAAFAPRPVFYRSIDWYARDSTANPIVGNRGTYRYLTDTSLFDTELKAIATVMAEGHSNLNLILPFVRSVEEFNFCRHRLQNANLTTSHELPLWIMAEVPSAIFLLDEYIRAGVKGVAIGTNDLTQLLLGVDRERSDFHHRGLTANHPAMRKAIAMVIQTAKANQIPCSICGQAPVQYPDLIERLVEWGITSISVEPEAVEDTYRAIARAERRLLLDRVINQDS